MEGKISANIMTKIHHIALWVKELENIRDFYVKYFNCRHGELYQNPAKAFSSYFIFFDESTTLEIMHRDDLKISVPDDRESTGYAHIAISLGSRENVNEMTQKLRMDGYKITGEPRVTGDGFYESVVEDPEGNLIELTE